MSEKANECNLLGSHILSVDQFDRSTIERLFLVADKMEPFALREKVTRVLEGAILGNLFFEPSTRTRVSFGSAFNLLGGNVRETATSLSSSLAKGESLVDTARILSSYSDIICMRHPKAYSVAEFASASRVPVINGGDGTNEHPTQALLDLYTIQKEVSLRGGGIDHLRIAMIGDLLNGRTVHSLSKLLTLFKDIHFTLISPPELSMPKNILALLSQAGHQFDITDNLEEGIHNVQIIYSTRIQKERFASIKEADSYRGRLCLNQAIYTAHCEPNTVIMHPLPRDDSSNELDRDLDNNPNLAIFRQADNGLLVRMALFALILGVDQTVESHSRPVHWFSTHRNQSPNA